MCRILAMRLHRALSELNLCGLSDCLWTNKYRKLLCTVEHSTPCARVSDSLPCTQCAVLDRWQVATAMQSASRHEPQSNWACSHCTGCTIPYCIDSMRKSWWRVLLAVPACEASPSCLSTCDAPGYAASGAGSCRTWKRRTTGTQTAPPA